MSSKSKVYFFFDNVKPSLRSRSRLKKIIEGIFLEEKKKLGTINYIFCSDKKLLEINQHYLKHEDYTDIITFDLSDSKEEIVGEVYISMDRVRDNAKSLKIPFQIELSRVVFHGALHLCGYKDKTQKEKKKMRQKEDYHLLLVK